MLWLLMAAMLLAGCASAVEEVDSERGIYEVAPVFREFHAALGGEEVLGSAISQRFSYEGLECQYTVNALMCQDPLLSGVDRFVLFPLGRITYLPANEGDEPDDEEFTIYNEFLPLYEQLSGERYVGDPISDLFVNTREGRIEQYFANLGFYRLLDDPPGKVRLLAYGAYACENLCNYTPDADTMLTELLEAVQEQPFQSQLKKLGLSDLPGNPLTEPYIAADGALQQVYMNVIAYSPADKPDKVFLRPVVEQLGMPREEPATQRDKKDRTIVFYEVGDGLGFHVPARVDKFITGHGGRKYSGDPLSDPEEIEPGVFQQCFTNYCLLYQPEMEKSAQVRMIPLGLRFMEASHQ